jgi:hypothetical protein
MMHDPEKSDRCIVPRKSSNNVEQSAAERMEGRRLVKGRLGRQRTLRAQDRASVSLAPARSCCATAWVAQTPNGAMVPPKTGARCGKAARRDLRGGLAVRPVPTATVAEPVLGWRAAPTRGLLAMTTRT